MIFVCETRVFQDHPGIEGGNLEGSGEVVEELQGGFASSEALSLVLESSLEIGLLDGLKEVLGNGLLLRGPGKTTDGSSGLVHVTGQLVLNVEPLLLLCVSGEESKTLLRLGDVSVLTGVLSRLIVSVDSFSSTVSVDGVGRVKGGGLIRTVSGTLRVRGSISDNSED